MKKLILGLLVLFSIELYGQIEDQTIFSPSPENDELLDLAKFLFIPKMTLSFNVSEKHVKRSYAEIENGKKYNEDYLNELLNSLKKDSLNPSRLNKVAEYYQHTNQMKLANYYYSKAYENLDSYINLHGKVISTDSAHYYSFRGLLKAHLRDQSAFDDFEKATSIKPNDSTSMAFYTVMLTAAGKLDKARSYVLDLCNANSKCETTPYMLLIATEIFFTSTNTMTGNKKDSISKIYRNKNYNDIFNYQLLDKYASLCSDNQDIQSARIMADILGLLMRNVYNEPPDSEISSFNSYETDMLHAIKTKLMQFNSYEVNKIQEMVKTLSDLAAEKKLNEHSLNKCLGFIYYMLKDWDKSIAYFNKAIDVFPTEKNDKYFNPIECYDALSSIYLQMSDTLNFRKIILKKIANEPNEGNTMDDLMKLAYDYFINGELEKAERYCNKVREINPDNFDALRLVSHLNFLKGSKLMPRFQMERAGRHIRNNDDFYKLLIQSAIYQIYDGEIKKARTNIEKAKEIRGQNKCALCDKLMTEYCIDKE